MTNSVTCKYCGSPSVVKHGFVEGVQKYLCKVCKRRFSADDRLFCMKTPASVSVKIAEFLTAGQKQ
jgi:transposase-like protein